MPDLPDRTTTERWATPCRNCGAELAAPDWDYCPRCGQETKLELPSVGEFLAHTGGRLLALDGRLGRTLWHLAVKPGVLAQAYLAGRRRYFVRPARLFFVLSLLLFAVLRLTADNPSEDSAAGNTEQQQPTPAAASAASALAPAAATPAASKPRPPASGPTISDNWLEILEDAPKPIADPLRKRVLHYKGLSRAERLQQINAGSLRLGPYVLFALLPVYAALMQLVYLGRSKRYPQRPRRYGEHLVQGAYLHCSILLAWILALLFPWGWPRLGLSLWLLIYLCRAQYKVYGGSVWGTLLRILLVAFPYMFCAFMISQVLLPMVAALL
ncbi:DUF3667 domain-containing protein [Paucibacter sp. AS339]|uniref:DUF3667 domain-containing protein n=1 Tax=Paucibacter hankyongi TaxID=3133434 RepID=UPI0030A765F0